MRPTESSDARHFAYEWRLECNPSFSPHQWTIEREPLLPALLHPRITLRRVIVEDSGERHEVLFLRIEGLVPEGQAGGE